MGEPWSINLHDTNKQRIPRNRMQSYSVLSTFNGCVNVQATDDPYCKDLRKHPRKNEGSSQVLMKFYWANFFFLFVTTVSKTLYAHQNYTRLWIRSTYFHFCSEFLGFRDFVSDTADLDASMKNIFWSENCLLSCARPLLGQNMNPRYRKLRKALTLLLKDPL